MKGNKEKQKKMDNTKKKTPRNLVVPVVVIIFLVIIVVGIMLVMDSMKTGAMLKDGEKLLREGKFELAATKLEGYLKKKPNDKKAYVLLSRALISTGKEDQAYTILRKLKEIDPKNYNANIELARFYITRGQNEKAKQELNSASKINPKDPEIYHLLGLIYVDEQNPDKAYETFKEVLTFDPAGSEKNKKAVSVAYKALLEIIGNQGRIDKEALSVITKAIKFLPEKDKGRAYVALGNYYYKQEKLDSALKRYKIALKKSPEDEAWANVVVAEIYEKKGDNENALSYYKKALEYYKDPKNVNAKSLTRLSIYGGIKKNELKIDELKEKVKTLGK
ncbi:MAG: tetratricopeptide repeat protein [Candidatus Eremiobacteraeota bacterium]|nr:tetratricopeptide repeat protein [Candidatus Eremiobacteraeota bacterium]